MKRKYSLIDLLYETSKRKPIQTTTQTPLENLTDDLEAGNIYRLGEVQGGSKGVGGNWVWRAADFKKLVQMSKKQRNNVGLRNYETRQWEIKKSGSQNAYYGFKITDAAEKNLRIRTASGTLGRSYPFVKGHYGSVEVLDDGTLQFTRRLRGLGDLYIPVVAFRQAQDVTAGALIDAADATLNNSVLTQMNDAQKSLIAKYTKADAGFVKWDEALKAIWGNVSPKKRIQGSIASDLLASDGIANFFKYIGTDAATSSAGKGEYLASTIFPTLVPIGAAATEAGVDLVELETMRKLEVKEASFRVGVKSQAAADRMKNKVKAALGAMETALDATRDAIVAAHPPATIIDDLNSINTGSANDDFAIESKINNYALKIGGCRESIDGDSACNENEIMNLTGAVWQVWDQLIENPNYSLPDDWLNSIIEKHLHSPMKRKIAAEIATVDTGEITRSRADIANQIAQQYNLSVAPDHEFFEGAWSKENGFDFEKVQKNIVKAYNAAVDPREIFKGTDIMIVSPEGFRIFTPDSLARSVQWEANPMGTISQSRGKFSLAGFDTDTPQWRAAAEEIEAETGLKLEPNNPADTVLAVTVQGFDPPAEKLAAGFVIDDYKLKKLWEWSVK